MCVTYFEQVKFASWAACADKEVLGEEEALSLPFLLSEREPRRTLLSFPLSTEGNWIKEPERKTSEKRERM